MLGTGPVLWRGRGRSPFASFALLICIAAVSPSVGTSASQTCRVPDLSSSLGLGKTAQRSNELQTCPQLAFPTSNRLRHLTASE